MKKKPARSLFDHIEAFVHGGDLSGIIAFLDQLIAADPEHCEALLYRLGICLVMQDADTMRHGLDRVRDIELGPARRAALSGYEHLMLGDHAEAVVEFRRALRLEPELEVFVPFALAAMPGPAYSDHLRYLHRKLRPKTYLEVGVFTGDTFKLAMPETRAIGIDPHPLLRRGCTPNATLHAVSSDQYFENIASAVLPELPQVSLAFLDGLHLFEQVLRDFMNLEPYCDPDGVIALHDTLPIAEFPTARKQHSLYWCGDVWKVVSCLEHYRPDLRIVTLPTFPSGLTLVTGLDPSSVVLRECFDGAVAEFSQQQFASCEERLARTTANVPNEFSTTAHFIRQTA